MAYQDVILAESGLVAYWRLNETSGTTAANSKPGGLYNGSYSGTVTLNQTGPTTTSKAVAISGTVNHVSIPHNTAFAPTGAFSVELWVKTTNLTGDWVSMIAKQNHFAFGRSTGQKLFFAIGGTNDLFSAAGRIVLNQWQHIVVTHNGTNTIKFYVNGVNTDTFSTGITAPTGTNTNTLKIGNYNAFDPSWPGHFSEVAYYNVALSATQVSNHYAAASDGTPSATPMKIMPLGDSLTEGWVNNPGGYRIRLHSLMTAANLPVNFVGTLSDGPASLTDKDHEGHSGQRIDQLRASIDSYLAATTPDAVLVHLGTNDILQTYQLSSIATRLQDLVFRIATQRPGVKIIVAKIVNRPGLTSQVTTFNNAIPGVVSAAVSAGYDVRMADLFNSVASNQFEPDNTHPLLAGFNSMADAWFPSVQALYTQTVAPTTIDAALWNVYSGAGTDNNGTNDPANVVQTGGNLELRGMGNAGSGVAMKNAGQTYGAWEVRALFPIGKGYAPLFSLWPTSNVMNEGFLQFLDSKTGLADATSQALYRINNPTVSAFRTTVGLAQGVFHTYRVEWTPTRVTFYVDGNKTFEVKSTDPEPTGTGTGANYISNTPHHLTMQLNVGVTARNDGTAPTLGIPVRDGSTPQPYKVLVDYVRVYDYIPSTQSGSISPDNSSFDEVVLGTGTTFAYDNTRARNGTQSAKVATGTTGAMVRAGYTTSLGTQSIIYGRGYWYFTSRPPAHRIAEIRNSAGVCADINLLTTGHIQLRQFDAISVLQSTEPIPLNQWVRIEWKINLAASGHAELRVFHDSDATVSSYRSAAIGNFRGAATDYRIGIGTNVSNAGPYWIDSIGWTNENWIGPESANDPPVVVAPPSARNTYGQQAGIAISAYDPDGTPLSYSWSLISAPAGASAFNASQTLPNVSYLPNKVGSHVFAVTVTDASGRSTTSQVTLDVKPISWQLVGGVKVPLKRKVLKGTPAPGSQSGGWGVTPWGTGPWGG